MSKRFIFVMQHAPTAEQLAAAAEGGREIVRVDDRPEVKSLLMVPEDPALGQEWFLRQAEKIVAAVGGIAESDTLHVMGQQQLAMAVSAHGRRARATLVESVTPRVSVDRPQPDGSVKKEFVFSFKGFRAVHEY